MVGAWRGNPATTSVEICTEHEEGFDQNTAQISTAWDSTKSAKLATGKEGFGETSEVTTAASQPVISIENWLDGN